MPGRYVDLLARRQAHGGQSCRGVEIVESAFGEARDQRKLVVGPPSRPSEYCQVLQSPTAHKWCKRGQNLCGMHGPSDLQSEYAFLTNCSRFQRQAYM